MLILEDRIDIIAGETVVRSFNMASLTLSLPDEMRSFIDRNARAGGYADPSGFVRALIRREMETGETAGPLASIRRGLEDIEHGRYNAFDAQKVRERVKEKIAARNNQE